MSERRIVDEIGAEFVLYADGRLGEDFIEYLARRLDVGRGAACQALSEWLHHHAGSVRPGLCKATPVGEAAASTCAFAASPLVPR